jgi:hypothetical protein
MFTIHDILDCVGKEIGKNRIIGIVDEIIRGYNKYDNRAIRFKRSGEQCAIQGDSQAITKYLIIEQEERSTLNELGRMIIDYLIYNYVLLLSLCYSSCNYGC